jgi:hypothetical protein
MPFYNVSTGFAKLFELRVKSDKKQDGTAKSSAVAYT